MSDGKRMKYSSFVVRKDDRLLPFIEKSLFGISRTKAKAILAGRGVMVDKNVVTQHDFALRPGMTVDISKRKPTGLVNSRFVSIVYEDHDLLVVDKAAGILSAPLKPGQFCVKSVLDDHLRRSHQKCTSHVVHRLDRDTSGLMVYAKNVETAEMLENGWRELVTDRRYVALVHGVPSPREGTIESWLTEGKDLSVKSSPSDNGGKYAVTHFRTLASGGGRSLVELKLETGRKHQIRVHLSDIGAPVCGDERYGQRGDRGGRLCLHAYMLCFLHPRTREMMRFETPIPWSISPDDGDEGAQHAAGNAENGRK